MWGRKPAHIVAFIRWVFWPIWACPLGIEIHAAEMRFSHPIFPLTRMNCSSSRADVSRPVRRLRRRQRVGFLLIRRGAGGRDAWPMALARWKSLPLWWGWRRRTSHCSYLLDRLIFIFRVLNWQVATALAVHKDGLKTGHEYE